ncbi:hypothetical protein ATO13_01080 [Stappia sp. 22II-S9-Z10]|nr:hypothetical protein ATO13_01080 [Stappia sp. 22II-S9-Z10]
MSFDQDTDATRIYRETSGVKTITMDRTGDTGSLLEIMRDAVVIIGRASSTDSEEKIPEHPWGSIDAYSQS